MGEYVLNSVGAMVTATGVPLGLVKAVARLAWLNCQKGFSGKLSCRQGFCDECSHDLQAVPSGD